MIRLITNSDDFGLTKSITDAIVDTFKWDNDKYYYDGKYGGV